jgi:NTP pyrophosphatase (non-canonical NTP hydrolase)
VKIEQMIIRCTQWSEERGILKNGTVQAQALKLVSEVGELTDNVAKGRDIMDDIGDCMVVLNNLAVMSGTTLEECLRVAYGDIRDRRGYLNANGVFVKESDTQN